MIFIAPKITKDYYTFPWDNILDVNIVSNRIRSVYGYNVNIVIYNKEEDKFLEPIRCKIFDINTVECETENKENVKSFTESDGKTFLRQVFRNGYIDIKTIQLSGKKIMEVDKFLNGFRYFGNKEKYKTYLTHIEKEKI